MLDIIKLQASSHDSTFFMVVYTVLVAFLLSSAIGFTYIKTFKGLSYSRNYVQALMMSSIVASTIMMAIGDSLANGLGMIGALAIIRFRTNFKDSRDIIFMFAALAVGIGCGVGGYTIAVVGTTGFILSAFFLSKTPIGQNTFFDGMLRFNMKNSDENKLELEKIMKNYCRGFALVTLRDIQQGERLDYAYHVKLKRKKTNEAFLAELHEKLQTIKGVNLMLQESTVEL